MDESQKYCAEWKKPYTKIHTSWYYIHKNLENDWDQAGERNRLQTGTRRLLDWGDVIANNFVCGDGFIGLYILSNPMILNICYLTELNIPQ